MQQNMVELHNVFLTLMSGAGQVNVLQGIDLNMEPGKSLSVVGPSGSGKTTMLMVIAGLERASRGQVKVAGQDLSVLDEDGLARFRRKHVGIVFQSFHLISTMTAVENIALPLEFAGKRDARERAEHALEAVGLHKRRLHYPGQLSGGEQQRVAIARAFVANPTLLLADEPTGNLDGETEKTVMDLLFSLQEKNKTTFILVTHESSLANRCDRTVRLMNGKIHRNGEHSGV